MKRQLIGILALFCSPLFALTEVGDKPKSYCWTDVANQKVCLEDPIHDFKVRVLIFNAGWCGPCNSEFAHIDQEMAKFKDKNVVFISLSCEGWNSGSKPDQKFLTEWQTKHKLASPKASFVIAGSPRHCGGDFFGEDTGIPNAVVIDTMGMVAYKEVGPNTQTLIKEIEAVLPVPCNP